MQEGSFSAEARSWSRQRADRRGSAGLLVLVRTLALFELTFLTSGASSQTLVVALYYAVFGAGVRPSQSIDAMAVVYMVTGLVLLLIALRFADPSGMIVRRRRE